MQAQDMEQLAVRLSAVAGVLERKAEDIARQMAQSAESMQRTSRDLGAGARQLARDAVSAITAQAQGAVAQGVKQAVDACNKGLLDATRTAGGAALQLQQQAHHLHQSQRTLLWKGATALLVGTALAAGGTSYLAWKNMGEVKRAEFAADILHATQSGALARCGDALCVKVGQKPERYGKQGEYVLVGE